MHELSHPICCFAPRKTKLAREFIVVVATRWTQYYGTPEILASDMDPALIGKLATYMCHRLGITDQIATITGLKCNQCETANEYVRKAIDAADANGDIVDADTFLLVVASA